MTYVVFAGCNIPARVVQYEEATLAVFQKLDIGLYQIPEFNCCGYPIRPLNRDAFVLSSAKNLAMAEETGFDMLVMCKCCYGNLKKAQHLLDHDGALNARIQKLLSKESLSYKGGLRIKHLLSVLAEDVGVETLKSHITKKFQNLSVAPSYGCHALRPSTITQFDHPVTPEIFETLVQITGAYSVDWSKKLECCGAPLMGINDNLSKELMIKKVEDARKSGANYLCTSCPYCHMQFDPIQKQHIEENGNLEPLASILYPQLLGLAMGIDGKKLGIEKNQLDISEIQLFLSEG